MKFKFELVALLSVFILASATSASERDYDALFVKYGKRYGIAPELLWGVAKTESDLNPLAIHSNKDGTFDVGLMQINTVHLPLLRRLGREPNDLYDPEVSVALGAYVLSRCISRHGFNYRALNCYNGRALNNPYSKKVLENIKKARAKRAKIEK